MNNALVRCGICAALLLLPFFGAFTAFGQYREGDLNTTPQFIRDNERKREEFDRRQRKGAALESPFETNATGRKLSKEEKERLEEDVREIERIAAMLRAPQAYYDQYSKFLKGRNTGLTRLFVDRDCDKGHTVTVPELERCVGTVPIKSGGSKFSFRLNNHTYRGRDWWDISFRDGRLIVGNETVQGLIAEIGDVEPEAMKKADVLRSLRNYEPKSKISELRSEREALANGISSGDHRLSNAVTPKPGSAYVMRSVAYRIDGLTETEAPARMLDVTVAFKVVGVESDGSVILLWKEIDRSVTRRKLRE